MGEACLQGINRDNVMNAQTAISVQMTVLTGERGPGLSTLEGGNSEMYVKSPSSKMLTSNSKDGRQPKVSTCLGDVAPGSESATSDH